MSTPSSESTERVRNLIAFVLIFVFVSTVPLLVWKTIPEKNEQLLTYILGQLSGMATTALAFYFTMKAGEAVLEAKRTENTGKALDAITAAASASPPPAVEPDVILKPGETAQAEEQKP